MVFHVDRGTIFKHERTPEGFLRVHMRIARVGELKYRNADGTERIEVVSPEVLFAKDSTDSFKMKPITLGHPPERVTAENARQYERGMTGHAITIDNDFLGIVGTVTDKETIDAIERGDASEVSCGYDAPIRLRPDGKYDQLSRYGNHVAAVYRGRAGSEVRFGMDSADEPIEVWVQDADEGTSTPTDQVDLPLIDRKDSPKMTIVTLSNRNYNIDGDDAPKLADAVATLLTEHAETLTKHDADLSSAKSATVAETKRADAAEAKLEVVSAEKTQLTQKLDAAEQTRMDADQISTEVEARLGTWQIVLPLLRQDAADFQPDYKLSVSEIQKLAIAKKFPEIKLDGKSDDAISAMWELTEPALKQVETRTDSSQDLFELVTVAQSNTEYRVDALDSARKKAAQAYADAWKQGEKE